MATLHSHLYMLSTFHCGRRIYIATKSLIDLSALKGKFEAESEREENETAVIRNRNRRGFAPQLESSLLSLAGKTSSTKKVHFSFRNH